MSTKQSQPRSRRTGQYETTNWDLLCKCGHTLGHHLAEGDHACDEDHGFAGCECERFRKAR